MPGRSATAPESSPGIRVFKGIPFAAPPVGALRWRAPQPVAKWNGVRDASKFGNVCIQAAGPTTGPGRGSTSRCCRIRRRSVEDCLYLNVWTGAASASERRPVMVYFFGGAFTEGSGSVPLYDGDALARKGAVVVTMNYRLGPYGFFVHPALTAESPHKASGNYGLMDMLASLRWVQSNIAAFGGDPSNVTVFGQSAGAMAIALARRVARSERPHAPRDLAERRVDGARPGGRDAHARAGGGGRAQGGHRGRRHDARAAARDVGGRRHREVPQRRHDRRRLGHPRGSVDHVRGRPAERRRRARRLQQRRSVLPQARRTAQQFEEQARARWGALADQFLALYPHATDEEASKLRGADARTTARSGTCGCTRTIRCKRGNKAYLYFFAQNPPGARRPAGVSGGTRVPRSRTSFNNVGELPLFPDRSDPKLAGASAPDLKVADQMSSYWVNFARTGNPNGAGLPVWQEHQVGASERAIILDAEPSSERLPTKPRLELYDKLYAQMRCSSGAQ